MGFPDCTGERFGVGTKIYPGKCENSLNFSSPHHFGKGKCGKTVTCLIFICRKQVDIFCLLFCFFMDAEFQEMNESNNYTEPTDVEEDGARRSTLK